MDIEINLHEFNHLDRTSPAAGRLTVQGRVERIESQGNETWHPTMPFIQAFLDGIDLSDLPSRTLEIEGKFLIVYTRGSRTFIFCDRFAWFKAFYTVENDRLRITSKITLAGSLIIDKDTATTFAAFSYVPGSMTLFESTSRLMPGECLEVDSTQGTCIRHFAQVFPEKEMPDAAEPDVVRSMHNLFRRSLEKRIETLGPAEKILVPISGGLDSRYLLGLALELVPASRLLAFSYGPENGYDLAIGEQIARKMGLQHRRYLIDIDDFTSENLLDTAAGTMGQIGFPMEGPNRIQKDYLQYGSVLLSGHPGDSIMGKWTKSPSPASFEDLACQDTFISPGDPLRGLISKKIIEDSFYYLASPGKSALKPYERWWNLNHVPKYTGHCIVRADIEFDFLSPYTDYSSIDYFISLPERYRLGRYLQIELLRQMYPKLARIPSANLRGASFTASRFGKRTAAVIDYARRKITQLDRRSNYLDFPRRHTEIVTKQALRTATAYWLPEGDLERLISHPKGYVHLLNLYGIVLLERYYGIRVTSHNTEKSR